MKKTLLRLLMLSSKFILYGICLQCLFWGILSAHDGSAQRNEKVVSVREAIISLSLADASIEEVFTAIEQKTNYQFFYDRQFIDPALRVNIHAKKEKVSEILLEISREAKLKFKQVNHVINVSLIEQQDRQAGEVVEVIIQTISVTGTVTSAEDNEGLPGVNVLVKGTSTGTVTDVDGNYKIEVPDAETVLVFSSIGFITEEVVVGNQTALNVTLLPDIQSLEEIVVVGYGTQIKREVTGAISSVDAEDINEVPVPSFDVALQGKATGVQVTQNSGIPGDAVRVMVRGTNSINASTEPLWIVDGLPVNQGIQGLGFSNDYQATGIAVNPLSDINPEDIESIDILKDAAATAIYGSRGSNGVIIVTTKSGKKGKGQISFNTNFGITQPINYIKLADGPEWLALVDQARQNAGETGEFVALQDNPWIAIGSDEITREMMENTNTNWWDEVMGNGSFQEYNFSASDGTDKTSYYVSAQYQDNQGIYKNNRLKKYSGRANLDFNPLPFLKVGTKLSFIRQQNQLFQLHEGGRNDPNDDLRNNFGARGGYHNLMRISLPVLPVYYDNGEPFGRYLGSNVAYSAERDNYQNDYTGNRTISMGYIEITPIKNLSVRSELGVDYISSRENRFINSTIRSSGAGNLLGSNRHDNKNWERTQINYNLYGNYNVDFLNDHAIALTAGMETNIGQYRFNSISGQNSTDLNNEFGVINGEGNVDIFWGRETYGTSNFRSYFGRFNYIFKDRYIVGGSFRRDGSSKFSPENRTASFPALSLGWIVSDERFMNNLEWLSTLKVRASYGKTGNNDIPSSQFITGYSDITYKTTALTLASRPARDLTWETTSTYDASVEFELFNSRLSGSVGYYKSVTDGLISEIPLTLSNGVIDHTSSSIANVGELENNGWEIGINSVNIHTGDFRWSTSLNLTFNKNTVNSLADAAADNPLQISYTGTNSTLPLTGTRVGYQISEYFMAEFAGIDDQGRPLIYEIDQEVASATNHYEVAKTGNTILATTENVLNNRFFQEGKTGLPTYYGGLTNNFSYKGFDLDILITFQGGNYILDRSAYFYNVGRGDHVLQEGLAEKTWSPDNPDADLPQLWWGNHPDGPFDIKGTTRFLKKGDFARLRSIILSYALPKNWVNKISIQNAKLFVNMMNVATLSKIKNFDPEVMTATGGILTDTSQRNLGQGVLEIYPFPQGFTLSGGVSITF